MKYERYAAAEGPRKRSKLGCFYELLGITIVLLSGYLSLDYLTGQVQASDNGDNIPANGWCAPENLRPYFGEEAENASRVCFGESSGDPYASNTSGEDSWGLFQGNLQGGAVNSFIYGGSAEGRQLLNMVRQTGADSCADAKARRLCIEWMTVPENSIRFAVWVHEQSGWVPWGAAQKMGIR